MFGVSKFVQSFKNPTFKMFAVNFRSLVFLFCINLKESGVLLLDELEKIFTNLKKS